jgi:hypothetical protein
MVIRLPTGRPKHFSLISVSKKKVSFIPNRADRLWGSSSFLFSGYRKCFFVEVKRPWHEADRSTLSTDEVQIKWSYNSTPPYPLRRSSTGKDLSYLLLF